MAVDNFLHGWITVPVSHVFLFKKIIMDSTPDCCKIRLELDKIKHKQLIQITDAIRSKTATGASYITYLIVYSDLELKRRYSEFSSFRKSLVLIYPTEIIPPIPEKTTFSEYAIKQTRAKTDPQIVQMRKRMLQMFLNRLLQHPVLSLEHMFHRFLEPGVLWTDVLHTAKVTQKKFILTSPRYIPPQIAHQEAHCLRLETAFKLMEKSVRGMVFRHTELAGEYSHLGSAYTTLSTAEAMTVTSAIENLGCLLDQQSEVTQKLSCKIEQMMLEPLHEYTQFFEQIKQVFKYRNEQQKELEHTRDTLDVKKITLTQLERQEQENQRIEEAYKKESNILLPKRGIVNIIGKFMDQDPNSTRRYNLAKTKESITNLTEHMESVNEDLEKSNQSIVNDLDRFHQERILDFQRMIRSFGKVNLEYSQQNLKLWQSLKLEFEKIKTP